MRTLAILRMLLIAVVVIGATGRAAAAVEPAPSDAGIEDQINQGIAMRRAGKDDAALGVFLDVEKRAPDSVRVLLHITTAALATGRWTMAYAYMKKAASHREDPYYQRHRTAIDNVERVIDQRVGQFRALGSPAGAEVRLSGELIGTLPMANAKVIEVGSYTLEVSKAGYFPLRRPVTIAGDGSLTQEDIDLREQKPFQASAWPGQTAPQVGALQGAPVAEAGTGQSGLRARWVTWSLAGAAVVAATASGVAFAIREQKASQWNDNSPNSPCLRQNRPLLTREQICGNTVRRDINVAEGVGIGTGIAAVAFGAGALIHWFATAHGDHPTEMTASTLTQTSCTPGLGSFVCSGVF